MRFVLFEDDTHLNFLPLVYFRPVWELRCGALTIAHKIENILQQPCFYLARQYLMDNYLDKARSVWKLRQHEQITLINGRWLIRSEDLTYLRNLEEDSCLMRGQTVLAFQTTPTRLATMITNGVVNQKKVSQAYSPVEHSTKLADYLWNLIEENGSEIINDYDSIANNGKVEGRVYEGVHSINSEKITIEQNAVIYPGVVIDAQNGPVWIDEGAKVMANAVLEGPLYIGKNSVIKVGAKIYENTTIGPVCKIGGEVEESIIQAFSNKQHDGFLGHSYLGSWINLGADTNNSDLKNNYGTIKVYLNGELVNTGKQFLGLLMGDHSKCAINTTFNTGSIVGVNCNIFGTGMPPKFIPSFSWGGGEGLQQFDFQKAIDVARVVMARRKITFSDTDEALFESVRNFAKAVEKGTLL